MVLLEHRLPDGSSHLDWMIAVDPAGTGPLVSFRLARRVDELRGGEQLAAEMIGDHRPAYLEYEGPVQGGRGHVRRLARGVVVWLERGERRIVLAASWGDPPRPAPGRLELERLDQDSTRWQVVFPTLAAGLR
jgi:hypothetical protein